MLQLATMSHTAVTETANPVVRFRVDRGKKPQLEALAKRQRTTLPMLTRSLLYEYAEAQEAKESQPEPQPSTSEVGA